MFAPLTIVLIAFLLTVSNRLYQKRSLFAIDSYALAYLTNIGATLVLIPFVVGDLTMISHFSLFEVGLITLLGVLWTYMAWVGNISVAQNDFSFKEVIRQTRIVWVVLAGVLVLGEQLSTHQALGIVLIISSIFIISFKKFSFAEHISSRPILLAWSVSFVAAAIVVSEKSLLTLGTVPVGLYAFLVFLLPSVFLSFFLTAERVQSVRTTFFKHFDAVALSTILITATYMAGLYAYQVMPISVVYPLIQTSTVIGVLIGAFFFEGGKDWKRKALAALVAVLGVYIINAF